MRTRLDEIVEEEIGQFKLAALVTLAVERIAELAFRHGVEMGGMAAVRMCESIRKGTATGWGGETVQPAPVETIPAAPWGFTQHGYRIPGVVDRRKGGEPASRPDRRQGERRKGGRRRGCPGVVCRNRRSGSDRRGRP